MESSVSEDMVLQSPSDGASRKWRPSWEWPGSLLGMPASGLGCYQLTFWPLSCPLLLLGEKTRFMFNESGTSLPSGD